MNAVVVGHARGLLHVVGDDHDRYARLELVDQLLDLQRRDRVERRARLVHQDHLGLDRERARDAQPLLLAAGQPDARLAEPVLDLVPQAGAAQRRLDLPSQVAAPCAPSAAGRRRRCRRSTSSGTGSASGRPCRSRGARRRRRPRRVDVGSSSSTSPSARAPGISSCMRLMQRTSVDLPQPDGPMIAVTLLARKSRSMPLTGCVVAVEGAQVLAASTRVPRSRSIAAAPAASRASRRRPRRERPRAAAPPRRRRFGRRSRRSPWVAVVGGHARRLLRATRRAMRVSTGSSRRASARRPTRAPRGGRRRADVVVDLHGQRVHRLPRLNVVALTAAAVNSSGAVSPAARATASSDAGDHARAARSAARSRKTPASAARRARAPTRAARSARAAARPRPSG